MIWRHLFKWMGMHWPKSREEKRLNCLCSWRKRNIWNGKGRTCMVKDLNKVLCQRMKDHCQPLPPRLWFFGCNLHLWEARCPHIAHSRSFFSTNNDASNVIMMLKSLMTKLMVKSTPQIYWKYYLITMAKGEKIIYVMMIKALLWYAEKCSNGQEVGEWPREYWIWDTLAWPTYIKQKGLQGNKWQSSCISTIWKCCMLI